MTLSPALKTRRDDPVRPVGAVGDDLPALRLVARADEEDEGATADVALHRRLRNEEDVLVDGLREERLDEHARQKHVLRIGEARPQGHRAGALVHHDLGKLDGAGVAVVAAVLELQANLRATRRTRRPRPPRA